MASPEVAILGASKGQSVAVLKEAIDAGMTLFGENRVQEAGEKWGDLRKTYPQVKLHLIGPLQSNKVKDALELFDVIETVDRMKLVDVLSAELRVLSEKNAHNSQLTTRNFYIQVNTGKEPQKAGVIPEEADALIAYAEKLNVPIAGLMCVPPADQPPAPHFALLKKIADRNGLKELSMGMSNDFETAIKMGSTCVRIGTALFGKRD